MGNSKWFFSMSGVILAVGAIAIAGSGSTSASTSSPARASRRRSSSTRAWTRCATRSKPLGYGDAEIQAVKDPELGKNVVQIEVSAAEPARSRRSRTRSTRTSACAKRDFVSNSVGPTFGAQIARTAVIAVVASLLLISLYIGFRFEWKFAVPVLIALAHDLLITAGVYALFDREVTTATVAALLTIMGYSLYDTVIVFDRIRENVPRMPRATFSQIANRSMSEVFTRSLATSFAVLMPVGSLLLFGGETLKDFAFALLVGVLSGAYSSIFIATPVLIEWKEREQTYMRRRRLMLQQFGGHIPAFAPGTLGEPVPAAAAAGAGAGAGVAAATATPSPRPGADDARRPPPAPRGRRPARLEHADGDAAAAAAHHPAASGRRRPDARRRRDTPSRRGPALAAAGALGSAVGGDARFALGARRSVRPPAKQRQKQKPKRQKRRKHGRR